MATHDTDDIVRECTMCGRCYPPGFQHCTECKIELKLVETIPSTINYRYQLTRVIEHGGTGVVFLGLDDNHERVVIKNVRASTLADPRAQDRFRREAGLACQFHHPNVARLIDFGMLHDASGYLVSEYIEGPTLRTEMNRRGQFEVSEAIRLLSDLCDGLDAAHRAGLLHRDLKPENIILSNLSAAPIPGIYGTMKIVGFSFTKIAFGPLYTPGATTRLQGLGHLPLRPNYLSPEQFRGEEADVRSDIFSIGVLAYEMLGGQPPFRATRMEEYGIRLLNERPTPLQPLNPQVNPALEAEILRALEKDPIDRQQRVIELKRELINASHLT